MKINLNKNKIIRLRNYLQKKLEEMNPVHVTQEKSINIVTDLYNKKIINKDNKSSAPKI